MPVRDGAKTIQRQLDALAASQTTCSWELIVADNGSTDGTQRIVAEAASTFPAPVHQIDASDHLGAAGARNAGVLASHGDKLLFCDADDIVFPDWIEAGAHALDTHPAVSGLCIDLTEPLDENARVINPGATYRNAVGPSLGAGNSGVRRDVMFAVGGYDESMGRYGHEDSEFSIRLLEAGFTAQPAPEMRIYYRDIPSVKQQIKKTWQRSQAEIMLWNRHQEYYGQFLDGDMLRHQVRGYLPWHVQLTLNGERMTVHDIVKDGVTRLARYRAFEKAQKAGGFPEPKLLGDDPRAARKG